MIEEAGAELHDLGLEEAGLGGDLPALARGAAREPAEKPLDPIPEAPEPREHAEAQGALVPDDGSLGCLAHGLLPPGPRTRRSRGG